MTISTNYPSVSPSINLDFVNSKTLDPRFSFTRAATSAYFYDGKTNAVAEQNLLAYSQTLQNAVWTTNTATPLDNQILSPDGINNTGALLTTGTSVSGTHSIVNSIKQYVTLSAGQGYQTASVYLKAGTSNFATLVMYSTWSGFTGWINATINLSTGLITQSLNGSSYITNFSAPTPISLGNGWYRLSISGLVTIVNDVLDVTKVAIQINDSGTPTIGNYGLETWSDATSTASIYVWGAQAELRSFAGPYQATTNTVVNNLIPQLQTATINQRRIDCDPIAGTVKGLLYETQSTNLLFYSSDYTQSSWSKTALTPTIAANISPDGTLNAQLLSATASSYLLSQSSAYTSGTSYTQSIYIKQKSGSVISLINTALSTPASATFNIGGSPSATVIAGIANSAFINSVGNGWYRIGFSFIANQTGTFNAQVSSMAGSASTDAFYLFGSQLEPLAFSTSYISTPSNQSVTRAQDTLSISSANLSSLINAGSGAIYLKATFIYTGCSFYSFTYGSWGITAGCYGTWGGYGFFTSTNANQTQAYVSSGAPAKTANQTITTQNICSFSPTAFIVGTDGYVTSYANNMSSPNLSPSLAFNPNANGIMWLSKFAIYPNALTTTQLQALTGS